MQPDFFLRLLNDVPDAIRWEYRSKSALLEPIWSLPVEESSRLDLDLSPELVALAFLSRGIQEADYATTWARLEHRLGEALFVAMMWIYAAPFTIPEVRSRILGYLTFRCKNNPPLNEAFGQAILSISTPSDSVTVSVAPPSR